MTAGQPAIKNMMARPPVSCARVRAPQDDVSHQLQAHGGRGRRPVHELHTIIHVTRRKLTSIGVRQVASDLLRPPLLDLDWR